MKTNADKSYSGVKNTCARECAFALVELAVVIVTLAILAALILPAFLRFTKQPPGCGTIFQRIFERTVSFLTSHDQPCSWSGGTVNREII
jgi:competence protein ComGC